MQRMSLQYHFKGSSYVKKDDKLFAQNIHLTLFLFQVCLYDLFCILDVITKNGVSIAYQLHKIII